MDTYHDGIREAEFESPGGLRSSSLTGVGHPTARRRQGCFTVSVPRNTPRATAGTGRSMGERRGGLAWTGGRFERIGP
jgi:hypothetical protein